MILYVLIKVTKRQLCGLLLELYRYYLYSLFHLINLVLSFFITVLKLSLSHRLQKCMLVSSFNYTLEPDTTVLTIIWTFFIRFKIMCSSYFFLSSKIFIVAYYVFHAYKTTIHRSFRNRALEERKF